MGFGGCRWSSRAEEYGEFGVAEARMLVEGLEDGEAEFAGSENEYGWWR